MTFEIKQGHALDVLRQMPDESVQCAITSPPYYGLRSYKTEPQIWGNHNGCSHEFGEAIKNPKLDTRPIELKIAQGATVGSNVETQHWSQGNMGSVCLRCNAWRGELGLEPDFKMYIAHLIEIFAEVRRVLKSDGACFVNLGDSYGTQSGNARDIANGKNVTHGKMEYHEAIAPTNKPIGYHKSLLNIPGRFAIAMTDELRMIQRNEIIWYKRACMPSSAKDRFTVDFEPIYFFTKSPRYKFNQQLEPGGDGSDRWGGATMKLDTPKALGGDAVIGNAANRSLRTFEYNGTRNKRCVWDVPFEPQSNSHYASYPTKLVEPMILAGTDEGDTVLDIFAGTGTTLLTALRHRRKALGIELNPEYIKITEKRLREVQIRLFS